MPLSIWTAAGSLEARGLGEGCPFFDFFGAVEYGAQAQLAIDRTRILEQAIKT